MDFDAYFESEVAEHAKLIAVLIDAVREPFGRLVDAAQHCLSHGGKLIFFGNGGSAADAQHIATELTVRYEQARRAIPALALTTDTSALTAIGNDFGFEELFARQVDALARPGDVVIGISTSGTSPNVIRGLQAAKEMGAVAAALTGQGGIALQSLADPIVAVPATRTSRIQEMHILLGHILCGTLEARSVALNADPAAVTPE